MKIEHEKLHSGVREFFPLVMSLQQQNLIYLDSAATAQKPQAVIDAMAQFYAQNNFPVQRSGYGHAIQATNSIEAVRNKVANFLNATENFEVIFTASATDSINLVAKSIVKHPEDWQKNVVISQAEHHSNIAPWVDLTPNFLQAVKIVPFPARGFFKAKDFQTLIDTKTLILAITLDSNVVGPVWESGFEELKKLIEMAHLRGAKVLLDASQAVAHAKIDLQNLNADFLVFSGHKIGGPSGIGILCANKSATAWLWPLRIGGGNVAEITAQEIAMRDLPHRLEGGTLPAAEIVGLGQAIDFLEDYLAKNKQTIITALCREVVDFLQTFPQVKILSNPNFIAEHGHLVSFSVAGIHAHDIAWSLNEQGILLRAGDHCAKPLHAALGVDASVRVSFFMYNNLEDVERFKQAFSSTLKFFEQFDHAK